MKSITITITAKYDHVNLLEIVDSMCKRDEIESYSIDSVDNHIGEDDKKYSEVEIFQLLDKYFNNDLTDKTKIDFCRAIRGITGIPLRDCINFAEAYYWYKKENRGKEI